MVATFRGQRRCLHSLRCFYSLRLIAALPSHQVWRVKFSPQSVEATLYSAVCSFCRDVLVVTFPKTSLLAGKSNGRDVSGKILTAAHGSDSLLAHVLVLSRCSAVTSRRRFYSRVKAMVVAFRGSRRYFYSLTSFFRLQDSLVIRSGE